MAAALSCAAGAGTAMVASSPAAYAEPGCTATYSVPVHWNAGFEAILTVTNSGTTTITGWTVTLTYPPGGNPVLQATGWNGNWSQVPQGTVTVTNATYNGNLMPGTTVTNIGAIFSFNPSGANSPPTVTCTPRLG
jgi:cellulose 1,4-beta-cellobiosidase